MKYLLILIVLVLTLTGCKDTEDFRAEYKAAKQELVEIGKEYGTDSPEYIEQNEEVNDLWAPAYPDEAMEKELEIQNDMHWFIKALSWFFGIFVLVAFVFITKKYSKQDLNFLEKITYFINPSIVFSDKTAMKSDWVVQIGAFIAFLLAYTCCIVLLVRAINYPSIHTFALFTVVSLAVMTVSSGFTKIAG